METIKIYLVGTGPKSDKKVRWFFGIYGILSLTIGILITLYDDTPHVNYYLMISGLLFLTCTLGYKKLVKRCHITLDDQGIESTIFNKWTKLPLYERVTVTWNEIDSIDVKPLKISIKLIDGTSKEIELGDLMYTQHQLLKTKLYEIIDEKKIKSSLSHDSILSDS